MNDSNPHGQKRNPVFLGVLRIHAASLSEERFDSRFIGETAQSLFQTIREHKFHSFKDILTAFGFRLTLTGCAGNLRAIADKPVFVRFKNYVKFVGQDSFLIITVRDNLTKRLPKNKQAPRIAP